MAGVPTTTTTIPPPQPPSTPMAQQPPPPPSTPLPPSPPSTPLPPAPLMASSSTSSLLSPRSPASPRASSPRTPRTNRAAEVRLLSKQRSQSMGDTVKSPSRSRPGSARSNRDSPTRSPSGSPARGKKEVKSIPPSKLAAEKAPPVDTYQEYEDLPKLPIPPLSHTLTQYLDNLRAISTDEEYKEAEAIVQQFGAEGGVGEKARKILVEKRENTDNWAYEYWLQDMYLNIRLPLPVNINPGMVFPRMKFRRVEEMACFTSRMILGLTKFKERLDKHALVQERATAREPGQPFCMEQYYRVLTSYRRPGIEQDQLISTGVEAKEEEVVMVGRKGHWYSLPVKSKGKWKRLEDIYSSLVDIIEAGDSEAECPLEERIAVMTANLRTRWAESLEVLEQDTGNKENIQLFQNALFNVCLDEETQNSSDEQRSLKEMFRQMLTGCGSQYNGTNRWFDKTVQLVVTMDGVCGLSYEHSTSEGIAVVQLLVDIIKGLGAKATASLAYHPSSSSYSKLSWNLDDITRKNIQEAMQVLDELDRNNDLEVFRYSGYGKDFIKSCRCSPDAWIQLALQLTIYRLFGHIVPTYESASTRRFVMGRVDSIRASHPESLAWVKTMSQSGAKEEKRKLFELAIKKQTKVMIDNILGFGLDIPLLGLKEATKEAGEWDNQRLFTDPKAGFDRLNHFQLSTSQVPVELDPSFMGYGAVVPDGYGVSYNPYSASIIFCIGSFHDSKVTNSRRFASQLQTALQDMQDLFIKGESFKNKL